MRFLAGMKIYISSCTFFFCLTWKALFWWNSTFFWKFHTFTPRSDLDRTKNTIHVYGRHLPFKWMGTISGPVTALFNGGQVLKERICSNKFFPSTADLILNGFFSQESKQIKAEIVSLCKTAAKKCICSRYVNLFLCSILTHSAVTSHAPEILYRYVTDKPLWSITYLRNHNSANFSSKSNSAKKVFFIQLSSLHESFYKYVSMKMKFWILRQNCPQSSTLSGALIFSHNSMISSQNS